METERVEKQHCPNNIVVAERLSSGARGGCVRKGPVGGWRGGSSGGGVGGGWASGWVGWARWWGELESRELDRAGRDAQSFCGG